MKSFIVALTLVLAVTASPSSPPKVEFAQVIGNCAETTGVSPEIIAKVKGHDLSFDDPKGKCFEKCMCSNLGLCDSEFKLNREKFSRHPDLAEKVAEFLPQCNELKSENDCETVHMRFKCIFEKVPEIVELKALGPPQTAD
uniref:CSON014539 protein n=1 Tax=Culicoides sonorensis TaxID=179676 RepID=A0A336MB24_CULSO